MVVLNFYIPAIGPNQKVTVCAYDRTGRKFPLCFVPGIVRNKKSGKVYVNRSIVKQFNPINKLIEIAICNDIAVFRTNFIDP
jgi:hypothetical protein